MQKLNIVMETIFGWHSVAGAIVLTSGWLRDEYTVKGGFFTCMFILFMSVVERYIGKNFLDNYSASKLGIKYSLKSNKILYPVSLLACFAVFIAHSLGFESGYIILSPFYSYLLCASYLFINVIIKFSEEFWVYKNEKLGKLENSLETNA